MQVQGIARSQELLYLPEQERHKGLNDEARSTNSGSGSSLHVHVKEWFITSNIIRTISHLIKLIFSEVKYITQLKENKRLFK